MEKNQYPPYDTFEKPVTKILDTKKDDKKCYHNAAYYCQLLISNLGICVLLIGYTLIGSFLFLWIEKKPESKPNLLSNVTLKPSDDFRIKTVENIWEITVSLNILYRENWTRLAGTEISRFQEEIIQKLTEDFTKSRSLERPPIEWNYARAFLYSLTVLTTIGFGGFSPRTTLGKMATIIYAVIGIPLMLLYLSSVGSVLSRCARGVCSRTLCCCLCSNCGYCCYDESRMLEKEKRMKRKREMEEIQTKQYQEPFYVRSGTSSRKLDSKEIDEDWNEKNTAGSILAPLALCLMIMFTYIVIGSIILIKLESWSFLECCYFCFMSLSTINLTDVLIFRSNVKTATIWICSVYILTGLALTAMCFNILHEELLKRLKKQIMKGLKVKKEPNITPHIVDEPSPDLYSNS